MHRNETKSLRVYDGLSLSDVEAFLYQMDA